MPYSDPRAVIHAQIVQRRSRLGLALVEYEQGHLKQVGLNPYEVVQVRLTYDLSSRASAAGRIMQNSSKLGLLSEEEQELFRTGNICHPNLMNPDSAAISFKATVIQSECGLGLGYSPYITGKISNFLRERRRLDEELYATKDRPVKTTTTVFIY